MPGVIPLLRAKTPRNPLPPCKAVTRPSTIEVLETLSMTAQSPEPPAEIVLTTSVAGPTAYHEVPSGNTVVTFTRITVKIRKATNF